jgi:hypothetical protein
MDYKKKYLKYKYKFIQLKNKYNLSLPYIDQLKNYYPSYKSDFKNTYYDHTYSNHKITYGEMEYDGLDTLLNYLSNYSFNSFIDIGSGRGKLCLYMASIPTIIKSIGIELVKERHDDALELKSKLSNYPEILKVEFINGDFIEYDFRKLNLTKVLIWISNLCFDQEITNKIFNKILSELPSKTIIACSKSHDFNNPKIKKLDEISVKMTWSKNSNIYIYEIN